MWTIGGITGQVLCRLALSGPVYDNAVSQELSDTGLAEARTLMLQLYRLSLCAHDEFRAADSIGARVGDMGTLRYLLLLSIGAIAAVGDSQSIRVGLRSSIPVEVADAAYRVRCDEGHVDWGPELSQALQRSTSLQPTADGTRVRQAILETLSSRRIAVPVAELLPFSEESPALVTAAIARAERRAGEDCLTLLKKTDAIRNPVLWLPPRLWFRGRAS